MSQALPAAPRIFDRALARSRLRRATAAGYASFLLDRVAADMVDRLLPVRRQFRTVLDCGTPGPALGRALREALPDAEIVRFAGLAGADVIGDDESLPFAPGHFDIAVSGLALQTANDLPGTLVQLRRVLKPDGLFIGCLLGGQTLTELRAAFAAAEAELLGGASPRVAPFADLRDLGGLLQRAGFALPVTDTDLLTVRYPSMFALMADLRAMGLTNAMVDRSRTPTPRGVILRAAEHYADRFSDTDGRMRASFELVWLSGWSPHESQGKPLRPGSATVRLADALAGFRADRES